MASPVQEQIEKVRELVAKSKSMYEKITSQKEEDITVGELKEQIKGLYEHVGKLIVCLRKISYLGTNDDIINIVVTYTQEVSKWAGELVMRLRKIHQSRYEENQQKIIEEQSEVEEEYHKAKELLGRVTGNEKIVQLHPLERQLIDFIEVLQARSRGLAELGAKEEQLNHVIIYHGRLLLDLRRIELWLKNKRMLLMRGTSSGSLEGLMAKILQSANDTISEVEPEAEAEEIRKAIAALRKDFDAIMQVLIQMFMVGSNVSLIRQAISVRDTVVEFIDEVYSVLLKKQDKESQEQKAKLDKIQMQAAQILQLAHQRVDKVKESPQPEEIENTFHALIESQQELLGLIDKAYQQGCDEEDAKKLLFTRDELLRLFDEVGLMLRDEAAQRARMSQQAQTPLALQGRMPNPEEQLDELLTQIISEAQAVLEGLQEKASKDKARRGIKTIAKSISGLMQVLAGLSQHGTQEGMVSRAIDGRNILWEYVQELTQMMRVYNKEQKEARVEKYRDELEAYVEQASKLADQATEISLPQELMQQLWQLKEIADKAFVSFIHFNDYARESDGNIDVESIEEIFSSFDRVGTLLREIVRAFSQIQPPSSSSSALSQVGGHPGVGMGGVSSGTLVGGAGVAGAARAGLGPAGAAGKGVSGPASLTQMAQIVGEPTEEPKPLPVKRKPPAKPKEAEEFDPTGDLRDFKDRIVQDRLEEMRKGDSLQGSLTEG
ncbi:MAG: hypothetical protein JRI96_18145, partial [Deltaproteobacteria bacterium]|nr:hypothetical protein [Deltaproteobacteria bacterium]